MQDVIAFVVAHVPLCCRIGGTTLMALFCFVNQQTFLSGALPC
jgi:hypothetical protein